MEDNVFSINENIFEDFFVLFDSAVEKLKALLPGWKPLVWRAGGFRIDEKSKDKLLSLLKERGIKSTTNYYTNDNRFKLNELGYFDHDLLPDIPMFKKDNRIGQFDFIGIEENIQYFINPLECIENNILNTRIFNMSGHLKPLILVDQFNKFSLREANLQSIEEFFKIINNNKIIKSKTP